MAALLLTGTNSSPAQVILDGTTGPAGPRLGPNYTISQSLGTARGGNLFHSFSQLNVRRGESLTFTGGGAPIGNLFARVTGAKPSTINGLLRSTIPGANLYLINPAGVVIGPDAVLDLQGSFAVTTAPEIRFADGLAFSASDTADPLLSSAAPQAFGFLSAPASLSIAGDADSQRLRVPAGKSLTLAAGDILIRSRTLQAIGGQINLFSGAADTEFPVTSRSEPLPAGVPRNTPLGSIRLLEGSSLNAVVGGRVVVRGGHLILRGGGTPENPTSTTLITTDTDTVQGGDIDISLGGDLNMLLSRLSAETRGSADGGDIRVHADAVAVRGFSAEGAEPLSVIATGAGDAGDIRVITGDLSLFADASISAITNGAGDGGDILIDASRRVLIDGTGRTLLTGLAAETQTDATGDSGSITVTAHTVDLLNNGEITSTTKGAGNAGDITIDAVRLNIDGGDLPLLTGLQARVGKGDNNQGATGRGGFIEVNVNELRLAQGGVLSATTFGRTPGGDIRVNADRIVMEGSPRSEFTGIFARSARRTNAAAGGMIRIDAGTLDIRGNAAVSALSIGDADAGDISITVTDALSLSGGGAITTQSRQQNAGDIDITAGQVLLTEFRDNIDAPLVAVDQPREPRNTRITAQALNGGEGNITLRARDQVSLVNSLITAEALDAGDAMISINSPFVILNNSVINGRSAGAPVPVTFNPDALLFQSVNSAILTALPAVPPPVDIAGSLVPLNESILDTSATLLEACSIRFEGPVSTFLVQGRLGTRAQPGGWIPDTAVQP